MSKRILVLEPSETLQLKITESTREQDFNTVFTKDIFTFLDELKNSLPDAVLIDAELENPNSFEVVRLIKTFDMMQKIPVGLFCTQELPFEDLLMQNSTSDMVFTLNENSLGADIKALLNVSSAMMTNLPTRTELSKNAIIKSLYGMIKTWTKMENVVKSFLNIVIDYCKIPLAAFILQEDDGPHCYYISAKSIAQTDTDDFLKVCRTDFENAGIDKSARFYEPVQVATNHNLEKFYVKGLSLSSYHFVKISGSQKNNFATVHVVSQENFSVEQLNLLYYCAENAGPLLENALMLKQKLFFEKRIRLAFSRFVPEQIIDELVSQTETQDKISVGEKREVAVLFSDIRSFTNISERNKPETIVSFLNRYFTIMVEIIKKHGGTIDKFIGDAIMALFGAPVSYEDNARRAVAAAYEMRTALASIPLEDLVMPQGMTFDIGIGINYGDLIVGSIGSKDKTDYSVIGDSVNLASRLEGLTKTYGAKILVSQSVKDDIKKQDEFVFRYLDDVKVKGKEVAVPIYAVDVSKDEFSSEYRDAYSKGMKLYKQGVFNLAKEYFSKALDQVPCDKASLLMQSRCEEFIKNPPEHWDGAIAFKTK